MTTNRRVDGPDDAASDVIVRPFGFVPDRAIIRRVGERNVYIGNLHAADPAYHDEAFEHVLSATSDPQPSTTHHHPLVDGHEVDWASFEAAVDDARTLLGCECPTLVHCRAGVSRSSAILTAALAVEDELAVRDALALVQEARPLAMPHPALFENAVVYTAAHADASAPGRGDDHGSNA